MYWQEKETRLDIELIPQAIKDMDKMYLEKCKEVNALVKTCERLEKEKR